MKEERYNVIFSDTQKVWIAYLDELDGKAFGTFELLDLRPNWVFLKTETNILIIPTHRILKIKKQRTKEEGEYENEKRGKD